MIAQGVLLVLALGLVGCQAPVPSPVKSSKPSPAGPPPPPMAEESQVMCPADVKICPDGSYVSRNPARGCAFDACPAVKK